MKTHMHLSIDLETATYLRELSALLGVPMSRIVNEAVERIRRECSGIPSMANSGSSSFKGLKNSECHKDK